MARPAAVALVICGCVGAIGPGSDEGALPPDQLRPGAGETPAMSPTGGATRPQPESAGPWELRRLTAREYSNTVRDLLRLPGYRGIALPGDALGDSGFISAGDVTSLHAQSLLDASEELARTALQEPSTALLPCAPATPAAEESCALKFIREFGKRAFRRPLGPDEVDDLTALYRLARTDIDIAYGFRDAIGLLIQRFLQSPSFLYHRERGSEAPVREEGLLRLGPYELASRLSYLLWETMPDPTLFAGADAGRLATPEGVAAAALRLLSDKRAVAPLAAFHQQWLAMAGVGQKDVKQFPDFDAAVRPSLDAELAAFIEYVFRQDARLETLLTAPIAFATPRNARLYGLPAAAVDALKPGAASRIDLDATRRGGLLTQLAFLADQATATGSSPVKRGLAVWRKVLCGSVPKPPPNVPEPRPPAPNVSTRERFAEHDKNPCATCHRLFDPPGFAFEHYDAIGAYRTVDGGKPVDSSGELTLPKGGKVVFKNAIDLMHGLASAEDTRRCLARQWFRYALGRAETEADEGSIEAAFEAAGSAGAGKSFDLRELLLAVVRSRTFRLRAPSPGETP